MDVVELHRRATEEFVRCVEAVGPDQWHRPTPCVGWDVRTLVNHVLGEERWAVELLAGRTIAEVGDRLDGDLLGDDPAAAVRHAARAAQAAVIGPVLSGGTVQLSYGVEQAGEYVNQLAADHLVHGWDLAVATGTVPRTDSELVAGVAAWFADREELYRTSGAIAARPAGTFPNPRDDLVAAFGRDPHWSTAHATVAEFVAAFGRGDVAAMTALMTGDCVFESTGPAPDGERFEGRAAVLAQWEELFAATTEPEFRTEESVILGDRAVVRWRYTWQQPDGRQVHVRGIDLFRVRDGLIAEKLSYVKG